MIDIGFVGAVDDVNNEPSHKLLKAGFSAFSDAIRYRASVTPRERLGGAAESLQRSGFRGFMISERYRADFAAWSLGRARRPTGCTANVVRVSSWSDDVELWSSCAPGYRRCLEAHRVGGNTALVIGSDVAACDMAEALAALHCSVSIVDQSDYKTRSAATFTGARPLRWDALHTGFADHDIVINTKRFGTHDDTLLEALPFGLLWGKRVFDLGVGRVPFKGFPTRLPSRFIQRAWPYTARLVGGLDFAEASVLEAVPFWFAEGFPTGFDITRFESAIKAVGK